MRTVTDSKRFIHAAWRVLSIGQVLLVAYLFIYLGADGSGPNRQLLAAAIVSEALGVVFFALWLTPVRLEALRGRLNRRAIKGALLAAGLGFLLLFGAEIRPEWLHACAALLSAATLALLYWTLFAPDANSAVKPTRNLAIAGIVLLLIVILLRLYSLAAYPPLHPIDEPWTLGWALSYARTGELSDWIMVGRDFEIFRFYQALGAWLKVAGEGLWQARFFCFFLTLLVIGFSTLAAQNLYGRATAFFTAAYLLSSTIMAHASRVRHDVGLAVAIAASLWLYSVGVKRGSKLPHFLAGLVMGLGLYSHYHAAFLGVALLVSLYVPGYLVNFRASKRPPAGFWLYGTGGLVAAATVLAVQPLPQDTGDILAGSPIMGGNLLGSTLQHIINISHYSQVELLLIGIGLLAVIWRRQTVDAVVVALILTAHLALGAASSGHLFEYYLIPLTPLYGITVGSLFGLGFQQGQSRPASMTRTGVVVACACFLAPVLGHTLAVPVQRVLHGEPLLTPPPQQAEWIQRHIAPGSTVVGEHYYFLWLLDYDYVSPLAPAMMSPPLRAEFATLEDVWDFLDVDVFIVDPGLSTYPLLQPLVESSYFERKGYAFVEQIGSTLFYVRGYNPPRGSSSVVQADRR